MFLFGSKSSTNLMKNMIPYRFNCDTEFVFFWIRTHPYDLADQLFVAEVEVRIGYEGGNTASTSGNIQESQRYGVSLLEATGLWIHVS